MMHNSSTIKWHMLKEFVQKDDNILNVYCFLNEISKPMIEYIGLYHTWVWNRGICMCVIVRPRSHMLIVLIKVIPDTPRYVFA